jgi:uncharacterized protein (TIGR02231 family)
MRLPFLLITLLIANFLFPADRTVTSKPAEVKVFLSGAQVMRTGTSSVPAGTSVIEFVGLPQGLDPMSLQINGKGGFTIMSVEHRVDHLTESPKKKEIESLQDQIKKLEQEINQEKALQQVWEQEEQLLLKNTSVAGQQNGVTAAQLQAVNDYVRERLKAAKAGWLQQQIKLNDLNEQLNKLRQQMQVFQNEAPRPTSIVTMEISSPAEVNASFTISYFVGDAGWQPAYDLRATDTGKPIELLMKAQVTNNTGEDWSKVDLSLSSGNPTLGGSMPPLGPWVLYAYRLQEVSVAKRPQARSMAPSVAESDKGMVADYEDMDANMFVPTTVSNRTTTFEFLITTPFSVPSDGRPHMVGVKQHTLPATYQHYVTPKLDKDAFLYARTTGWEDLDLLPGTANIFFEGTYVGQTHLDLSIPRDTLEVSLGRDKGVVVERVKRKKIDEKGTLGAKRTVTVGWDINVRNNKNVPVDLEIRDQYPLSQQSEIEVKLEEKGEAIVDDQTGMLKWRMHLPPKGSKKLGFAYSVKYPKDMPVVVE